MRFDLSVRESVKNKLKSLADDMSQWEYRPRIQADEAEKIIKNIKPFSHQAKAERFHVGGVDGSGDYPAFSYSDSFVYVASASGTIYKTDSLNGLIEEEFLQEPNLEFLWIPEDAPEANRRWIDCFKALSGMTVWDVIKNSDYKKLKEDKTHSKHSFENLYNNLILPRASDTANVGIQLRSTAEFGAALRLIQYNPSCRFVLMDTTMSLPMVTRRDLSLFYEHLKRLCCVEARNRQILFITISKSHGFPSIELIEKLAQTALDISGSDVAEHWFLRLPIENIDGWSFSLAQERRVPPIGAITYLFRLHKNTPIMRMDMDYKIWEERLKDDPEAEAKLFSELDYTSHDQRAYGYPYPIKASHDRSRLTKLERTALRKQIIDAAVAAGMKRSLFRDVSAATGHG